MCFGQCFPDHIHGFEFQVWLWFYSEHIQFKRMGKQEYKHKVPQTFQTSCHQNKYSAMLCSLKFVFKMNLNISKYKFMCIIHYIFEQYIITVD